MAKMLMTEARLLYWRYNFKSRFLPTSIGTELMLVNNTILALDTSKLPFFLEIKALLALYCDRKVRIISGLSTAT